MDLSSDAHFSVLIHLCNSLDLTDLTISSDPNMRAHTSDVIFLSINMQRGLLALLLVLGLGLELVLVLARALAFALALVLLLVLVFALALV